MIRLTRRTMLAGGAALAVMPGRAFAAATAVPGFSAAEQATLAQLAFDLFPHPRLGFATYRTLAATLAPQVQPDARRQVWRAGLARLEGAGGRAWRLRPPAARLQALRALARDPVFADLRASIAIGLYHAPDNARRLGFPGPSAPEGGYVDRGFNDLAWLPEPTA